MRGDFVNFWLSWPVVRRLYILSSIVKVPKRWSLRIRIRGFREIRWRWLWNFLVMTSEIFRVNVLIRRFHIGKMNEILSDNFGAKYSRNSRTCRIKYDCAFIIIFYVRKMNNSFSTKFKNPNWIVRNSSYKNFAFKSMEILTPKYSPKVNWKFWNLFQ